MLYKIFLFKGCLRAGLVEYVQIRLYAYFY